MSAATPEDHGAPDDQTAPYDDSLLASEGAADAIISPAAVMQMREQKCECITDAHCRSKGWSDG